MATDLDQFGQYLQQLHPHCKNGLSQMDCKNSVSWASAHLKFLEYLSTPSAKMRAGLFVTQKGFSI